MGENQVHKFTFLLSFIGLLTAIEENSEEEKYCYWMQHKKAGKREFELTVIPPNH